VADFAADRFVDWPPRRDEGVAAAAIGPSLRASIHYKKVADSNSSFNFVCIRRAGEAVVKP
jgi:hypothetical protein